LVIHQDTDRGHAGLRLPDVVTDLAVRERIKTPRRMRFRVISAKKRSTRLSHEDEVGVKWR
jgi:hypothetical protein